jgi:hypothetical protein
MVYIVTLAGNRDNMKSQTCYMCQKPIIIVANEEFYLLSALNFNNKYRKSKELKNDIFICKKCFEKTKMYKKMIANEENDSQFVNF